MIAFTYVSILAFVNQKNFLNECRLRSQAEQKCARLESNLQTANTHVGNLEQQSADLNQRLQAAKQRNTSLHTRFEQVYLKRERRRWFGRMQKKTFRSKADIGVYLLYPMLHFLGYTDDAFAVDYPITLVGGPRGQAVLVSYYVFTAVQENVFAPRLLLEAIPPDEGLTNATREQVKLKAFSAQVPKFGVTDGNSFELYLLTSPNTPLLQCRLGELRSNWTSIKAQIGADTN